MQRGPGYDFIIQGIGGIMDLTGEPDGAPQKCGVAFADLFTGLYSVIAIQAALAMRERTGCGQHIDMALLDTMTGVLANQAMNYFLTGVTPPRIGNAHVNVSPYAVFPAADGWFILAVGNDAQFRRFCAVVALDASDPRWLTNAGRLEHREPLFAAIEAATRGFDRDDLLTRCEAAGVPAGPINTVEQAFADPQVVARGMRIAVERDDGAVLPGAAHADPLLRRRPRPRPRGTAARFDFPPRRGTMTRFTVNNQPVEYRMDPQTPLLWALRDASNLTGAKYGLRQR